MSDHATPESLRTRFFRTGFNWFPAYRGTGARVAFIASDWSEVHVELPLNWRTRNYVGTIFGGSMYGAIDPIYMMMLIQRLGPEFTVWDKAAAIRFRRPGRTTLLAKFRIEDEELAQIREAVAQFGKIDREYSVNLVDSTGQVHAICQKVVNIRDRRLATKSSSPPR